MKWHKDHHSGDTIDKINKGSGAIFDFASGTIHEAISIFVSIFGSLIILIYFDWRAAAIALIFSIFSILIIVKFDKKLHKQYRELINLIIRFLLVCLIILVILLQS